jgi:hypothetical protein
MRAIFQTPLRLSCRLLSGINRLLMSYVNSKTFSRNAVKGIYKQKVNISGYKVTQGIDVFFVFNWLIFPVFASNC